MRLSVARAWDRRRSTAFRGVGALKGAACAYTLVEIMVVLAIIALLMAASYPAIKAMQESSGRSLAFNTINAALQAARSYAIMNRVYTAARFQPNGKIVLIYRFTGYDFTNPSTGNRTYSQAKDFGGSYVSDPAADPPDPPYPRHGSPEPFLFLPVSEQQPLELPKGFAVADPVLVSGSAKHFEDPVYVCYKPDGTLAATPVFVAVVDTSFAPVNPDFFYNYTKNEFDGAWGAGFGDDPSTWVDDLRSNKVQIGAIRNAKLTRFYYVARSANDLLNIFSDEDDGADHYAGWYQDASNNTTSLTSVAQLALVKTPEDWTRLPMLSASGPSKSKAIKAILEDERKPYESVFVNAYTGRIMRPME